MEYLEQIFLRLKETGLQINLTKSALSQWALEYLGFWVTREGYKPLASRIQGILEMERPRSKKEVRIFNSMVNFIKNHISQHAAILEPIKRLIKDGEPFVWKEEQDKVFKKIKVKIAEQMVLVYLRMDKTFHLYPDACDVQIGAFLQQERHALGCFSRKLNDAEKNIQSRIRS